MEKLPIIPTMGVARVDSHMEGSPIQLIMGRPPAQSEMGGPQVRARMEVPPMGGPPAPKQMGGPPTVSPMGNPPGLSQMETSPTRLRRESPPIDIPIGSPPVNMQMGGPSAFMQMGGPPPIPPMGNRPGLSQMETSPTRSRRESSPIDIPIGSPPPANMQMRNAPARAHMEHLPAMSMGSPQTHSVVGSRPARSSIGTSDSLRSSQHPSMCCSSMRQASSLAGTGDLKCTSTTNTLATSTSFHNTNPDDYSASISWVGDFECGVPSAPQHVRIDFTPNEGDTEFMKKKCSDFWKFIHSREDLQGIMVSPEPDKYPFLNEKSESSHTPVTSSASATKQSKDIPVEKTALSLLEFAEEKGIADQALDQKFCNKTCSIPYSSPHSKPSDTDIRKPVRFKGLIERRADKARVQMSTSNVRALCKELDDWDKTHPKSMEPPSHNPPPCYAVLQRKTDFYK